MAFATKTRLPIARLEPSVDATTTYVQGAITLVWPYSSSKQTWSFLLVEPDFRLRRQRGQVRISFSGACARRTARSGIASGDEISLALDGARWEEDAAQDQTPGRSVGWTLAFGKRVIFERVREVQEGNLVDTDRMSPSPEPEQSLLSITPPGTPIEILHTPINKAISTLKRNQTAWSSPAFLKNGASPSLPFFGRAADPFWDEEGWEQGPPAKRAKFGRGSGQWRFVERTPSPDPKAQLESKAEVQSGTGVQVEQHEAQPEQGDQMRMGDETPIGQPEIQSEPGSQPQVDPEVILRQFAIGSESVFRAAPKLQGVFLTLRPTDEDAESKPPDELSLVVSERNFGSRSGDSSVNPNENEDLEMLEVADADQGHIDHAISIPDTTDEEESHEPGYADLEDQETEASVQTEIYPDLPDTRHTPTPSLATSHGQALADAQPRSSPYANLMSSPTLASSPPFKHAEARSFRENPSVLRLDVEVQRATPCPDSLSDEEAEVPDTPRLQPSPSPVGIVSPLEHQPRAQSTFSATQKWVSDSSQSSSPQPPQPPVSGEVLSISRLMRHELEEQASADETEEYSSSFATQEGEVEVLNPTFVASQSVSIGSHSGEESDGSSGDVEEVSAKFMKQEVSSVPSEMREHILRSSPAVAPRPGSQSRPIELDDDESNSEQADDLDDDESSLEQAEELHAENSVAGKGQDNSVYKDFVHVATAAVATNFAPPEDTESQPIFYDIPDLEEEATTLPEGARDEGAGPSVPQPTLQKQDTLFERMMVDIELESPPVSTTMGSEAQIEHVVRQEVDEMAEDGEAEDTRLVAHGALQVQETDDSYSSPDADGQRMPDQAKSLSDAPSYQEEEVEEEDEEEEEEAGLDEETFAGPDMPGPLGIIQDLGQKSQGIQDTYHDELDLPKSEVATKEIDVTTVSTEDNVGSSGLEKSSQILEEPIIPKDNVQVVVERATTKGREEKYRKHFEEPATEQSEDSREFHKDLERLEANEPSESAEGSEELEMQESQPQYTTPSSPSTASPQRHRPLTRAQSRLQAQPTNDRVTIEEKANALIKRRRNLATQYPHTPDASQQVEENPSSPVPDLTEASLPTPRLTQKPTVDFMEISKEVTDDLMELSQEGYHETSTGISSSEGTDDNQSTPKPTRMRETVPSEPPMVPQGLQDEASQIEFFSQQLPSSPRTTTSLKPAPTPLDPGPVATQQSPLGFRTPLSYYVHLPSLHQHLNRKVDCLTVCIFATKPRRARSGPRDYTQTLYLSDPSSSITPTPITTVQLFRPYSRALPSPKPGDVVLLRECKATSQNPQQGRERRVMLTSTSASAWAVWKADVVEEAGKMEVKGPPVEIGAEERGMFRGLSAWWVSLGEGVRERIKDAIPSSGKERDEEAEDNGKAQRPEDSKADGQAKAQETGRMREITPVAKVQKGKEREKTPDRKTQKASHRKSTEPVIISPRRETAATEKPNARPTRRTLRSGMEYSDEAALRRRSRGGRGVSGDIAVVHELRDGTQWTDGNIDINTVHKLRDGTQWTDDTV
ncbi:MAG: hypothetical protein LQ340_000319 [Diploschistes diacapsis]|nr:MAG: hypothetical protein LQ340_000319 [Diploschistes diacapsis]